LALQKLSSRPELCQEIGKNARVLAEREFDRVKLAARLEDALLKAGRRS
jgi:hypothetical protein